MPYEVELLALALLLYIYDSSALLHYNEAILVCDSRGRWSSARALRFGIAGRTLYVLNPFTPHRPAFRLQWNFKDIGTRAGDPSWSSRAKEVTKLSGATLSAWCALFVLLPLGMLTPLGTYAVIAALVLLYGSALTALFQVRYRLKDIGPTGRRFWATAFECIACPPFAVNLIRRISLSERIVEPAPMAAARLFAAEPRAVFLRTCVARLEAMMQLAADNPDDLQALSAQKLRLLAMIETA